MKFISIILLFFMMNNVYATEYWTNFFSEEGSGRQTCDRGYAIAGIKCQGNYCDNKQLLCRSYPSKRNDSSYWHSSVISEEGPNASFRTDKPVNLGFLSGLGCSGGYCDNISFKVLVTTGMQHTGGWEWKPFFSEEYPSQGVCKPNQFVTGIGCKGKYCDNISIHCSDVNYTQ